MSEYITLLGAEDVSRAASRMQDAAEAMGRAASSIDDSVYRLIQAMDDHAARIETALAAKETRYED